MNNSRRSFLKAGSLLGISALSNSDYQIPEINTLPTHSVFLFQGDSITDGNRGRNNDLNHIMGHGYAYAIASRIGADFPSSNYQFINKGISGNAIPDLEKRWKEDVLDIKPQVLSLLVGINDINRLLNQESDAQSFEAFKIGYQDILHQVYQQNPSIIIALGLPFVAKGSRTNRQYDAFAAAVQETGKFIRSIANTYQAEIIDYPALFEKAYQKQSVEYWIWDGVHPTIYGHELMAREWIKTMRNKIPFLKKYRY